MIGSCKGYFVIQTLFIPNNEHNAGSLALVYTTVAYMALDGLGGSVVVQVNPRSGSS